MKKNHKTTDSTKVSSAGNTPDHKTTADEKLTRILYVTPETMPFASTGGLGEVSGSLPKALNADPDLNAECRVMMPLYKAVSDEYRKKMIFLGCKMIPVAWRSKYLGLFRLDYEGVVYYFIDNEEYFNRDGLYGHYDDCERFAFFSRAVFESFEFMDDFVPDIIHANDWQTALVPIYQDALYHLEYTSTVFSIHNIEYQGNYGKEILDDVLGLPEGCEHLVEWNGNINLMKGGIQTASLINTVSPTYAQELTDPYYAYGLDAIIRENRFKLHGILNGINTKTYDPAADDKIPAGYTPDDLSGKAVCKKALQEALRLPVIADIPMLTMITRLVPAKGVDLIISILESIVQKNAIQFVILGTGFEHYEDYFLSLQDKYPDKVRAKIEFSNDLSHKIYAAGDIFIMPSRTEPCGLAQMIACRYGNVPIVRSTGGLRDSIRDCTLGEGNGFVFEGYDAFGLYDAVMRAISLYNDNENWKKLVSYDLTLDFSWSSSAKKYMEMYRKVSYK